MKSVFVNSLLLLGICSAGACKDKPSAPSTAATAAKTAPSAATTAPAPARLPAVPTPPAAAAPKLVLAASKIDLVRSGLKEVKLDAEGNITVEGKPYAKLSVDGKISKATGEVVASIADDGTVVFAGPTMDQSVYSIDEHGKVTIDGEEAFRIDEDGSVWRRGPDGKMLNDGLNVYDGPATSRRAVALFMVANAAGGQAAPPPPPSGTRQR
jgi:hypothetical protein